MSLDDISDVLMVGGSTLLPGVYDTFEEAFGRDRVRAWQPFEAVAYGAAAFATGSLTKSDFIVHDYSLRTYRNDGQDVEQQAQRIHSYRPSSFWRSSGDCSRSIAGAGLSLIRYGMTFSYCL